MTQLIDAKGWPKFGHFDQPVDHINYKDARQNSPMGGRISSLGRHFSYKQFQFFGILSEEIIFGCALVDIRYLGSAFYYLYHPKTGTFLHRSLKTPFAMGLTMGEHPNQGQAKFSLLKESVSMESLEGRRGQRLVASFKDGVEIDATFLEDAPPQAPMSICTRVGASGWVYAQKTAGVTVEGQLTWPGGTIDLGAVGALGHRDWSAGFMRRETWWNWGCLAARIQDGRAVGLNISCGVNETGLTENCFWIDGALHKVGPVQFDYDRTDLFRPWRMTSQDGSVNLTFTPEGRHVERINAWVVASNFQQLFGRYEGHLGTGANAVQLDGVWGFAEDHFARW